MIDPHAPNSVPTDPHAPTEQGGAITEPVSAANTAASTGTPPPLSPAPDAGQGGQTGTATSSTGQAGPSNTTGPSGPTGPTGPTGSTSSTGTSGTTATTGPAGTTGASGPGGTSLTGELNGSVLNQDELDFLNQLESAPFSIESQISEPQAVEAIVLFAVVNIMLAGQSQYKVGNEDKTDVLGILNLFYGLQDKSLTPQIVVNSQDLWGQIQLQLKALRDELDLLGSDALFLTREAKRQFNLGRNNDVAGNTAFSGLFKRYVDIASDPLLTLDIRQERDSQFSDKEHVGQALALLRDLKDVILQTVRSLSQYGTIATSRANQDWSKYQHGALDVLLTVGNKRISDDLDDQNPWKVLADLTGKDRDRDIAPHVALGRDGASLLGLALETYHRTKDQIDNFDEQYLLDLFQQRGDPAQYLTTLMRTEATVIQRHPLDSWA